MKDGAEVVTKDEKNDVYLASGRSINVTGTLTKKPAARITPDSYTDGRVLATGDAEKANFTVTPKNGSEHWRYKKKDGVIKFVPATLTVTFMEIKCVKVNDAGDTAEYYWTMKVNGKILSEREDKSGKRWENVATGDTLDISEESFRKEFRYFPVHPIPVDIDIHEDDVSGDDDMGTTKALLTYDYDNDQWKWAYNGSQSNGNQESNTDIRIGDGKTETFTEEYRNKDKGDTDVTIRISWKE